ncbi:MAG: hypothetical protein WCL44_08830 [bacterium]
MIKRQYTLYMENRPDALTRISGILAKADVNIEGISIAESADAALIQLIVDKEPAARKALVKAKIQHTTQDVSVIVLPHRPGILLALAAGLKNAKAHINYVYATAADADSQCCIVVSASNLKSVERVARKLK